MYILNIYTETNTDFQIYIILSYTIKSCVCLCVCLSRHLISCDNYYLPTSALALIYIYLNASSQSEHRRRP